MKGIILAGGSGSRLLPLTKITNKHLLPVYNKPMIYFPLKTLLDAGITDILIVSGRGHVGHFLELLGSGVEFNAHFTYEIQETAGGIAHALSLAKHFIKDDNMIVVLGDNIFEDNINEHVKSFVSGAHIFLKSVKNASRFGVAEIDKNGKIINIEEKPKEPKSNYAVTGLYIYDNTVFDIIKTLKPSNRGELELTDVNNEYINKNNMNFSIVKNEWTDAGTFDSLLTASLTIKKQYNRSDKIL